MFPPPAITRGGGSAGATAIREDREDLVLLPATVCGIDPVGRSSSC
ncbi:MULTISPECIES: hypothetical protein [Kocuria]|nr:hypothetical protein [Kocuria rosea]WJZ66944.1 hypothetical protein QR564_02315 [Kocuria rosea]